MAQPRQVIFEFTTVGAYVKVAAIDADTGFEVSIVGDPRRDQRALERTALKKLEMVMAKQGQGNKPGGMNV